MAPHSKELSQNTEQPTYNSLARHEGGGWSLSLEHYYLQIISGFSLEEECENGVLQATSNVGHVLHASGQSIFPPPGNWDDCGPLTASPSADMTATPRFSHTPRGALFPEGPV